MDFSVWKLAFAALPVGIWIYLIAFRGFYWLERPVLRPIFEGENRQWPHVTAIVPARNEADVIEQSLLSLINQDYPGTFSIVLVDDHSNDGTSEKAQALVRAQRVEEKVTLLSAKTKPAAWLGKTWALQQGTESSIAKEAKYLWFTDADIAHAPQELRWLVGMAEADSLNLVSLMVRLTTSSKIERLLVPAYVYFFMKLYPFSWVRDRSRTLAAAAGGSMLVPQKPFSELGGCVSIRDQIIDDCAMGRLMKRSGPIWLGLADNTHSLRPYRHWREIWDLIARSAFAQLKQSTFYLLLAVIAMALTYIAPVMLLVNDDLLLKASGVLSTGLMMVSYIPIARYYGLSYFWVLFLPLIAVFYMGATIASAFRHWRGAGIKWKNRVHFPT